MVLSDKLWHHLADVEEQAQQRMDVIIQQMKEAEGVKEELKAKEQMEWVWRMNSICNRAEEIVLREIVFEQNRVVNVEKRELIKALPFP